jgi:hypothetical protein
MHFRRKRIVHFVVKQIPALFAHGNELLYRIIFFFKTHCCHEFLQATTPKLKCCRSAPPKSFFRERHRQYDTLAQSIPLRSPKELWRNLPTRSFFLL